MYAQIKTNHIVITNRRSVIQNAHVSRNNFIFQHCSRRYVNLFPMVSDNDDCTLVWITGVILYTQQYTITFSVIFVPNVTSPDTVK